MIDGKTFGIESFEHAMPLSSGDQFGPYTLISPLGEGGMAASPPNSGDIFTNVEYRDGRLVAWTWEGFMISIDPETGKPLQALFSK